MTVCDVLKDIPEILAKFLKSFSLSHIVGIVFEISKPRVVVFPIDVSDRLHVYTVPNSVSRFNIIFDGIWGYPLKIQWFA